ncbi:MAG TPA: uroporphyrinogen-III synthase [Rhizomicrobium sp.]|nr:uroporphyrinogen-III synthase [Rhizomicrobium sp.]
MRILVTRPLEDGREIAALLAARGHHAMLAPLLEPRFHPGPALEEQGLLDDIQAVLATSANGVRALGRRTARRDIPIFAVGPQTAEEASRAGFKEVKSADGDANALAAATGGWAAPGARLLHVCAQDAPGHLAEALGQSGFMVRKLPLYAVEPASHLPDEAKTALQDGALDAVMLFSPRTAQLFRSLAEGLPTNGLTAFCISAATAEALKPMALARVAVAARPNQAAMLALIS